jgi:hypothetical protein
MQHAFHCTSQAAGTMTTVVHLRAVQLGFRTWYAWASDSLQQKYRWGGFKAMMHACL